MKYERADKEVEIYWWNMGTKTKDFIRPIGEYLENRDIKVRKGPSKEGTPQRWIFKINVSSISIKMDIYENQFDRAAEMAIQIFLTMMGDRALLRGNRDYKINWR